MELKWINLDIKFLAMFPFVFIFFILVDQVSKYIFEHFFATSKIHILGDFLVLSFVKNTGIAFSFPIEGIVLKVLTIALIIGIVLYYFRYETYKNLLLTKWAYILILSGAVSNGLERVFVGSVTDFIGVKYFAIFNFADIFISIGAFLLFVIYFKYERANRD
ncbi:signal peptidase II [Candidatus Gracilibacteria bacterium CG1_02_38_174]|nr:MAG: signal peptidase II [Candidatus Gracilibacteria bacterium CG1_02_38_174]PIQ12283.1 MAG: signal peptidase II [Candidatus Gracilibacteria bacterium CG18_big_fil_WC_8_21_14_2_50_38_16]PIQ42199.1 MAG: signal peptidase II [Candidatus Gracilibacteria bacterium CG12_big_fil_rev_8_21_14_0_65_38_15]PIZ01582.1 MAG: signal peptidase II [Candidatus Gracilibacteria bacterium CG_4_10_14_0_8_um_filter_38_28]